MWLSLVEYCVRDAGAARSNRAIPTKFEMPGCARHFSFLALLICRAALRLWTRPIPGAFLMCAATPPIRVAAFWSPHLPASSKDLGPTAKRRPTSRDWAALLSKCPSRYANARYSALLWIGNAAAQLCLQRDASNCRKASLLRCKRQFDAVMAMDTRPHSPQSIRAIFL